MTTDIRFGLIGLGLMGREFASAAARWSHLTNIDARPVLTAVCDMNENAFGWFKENVSTFKIATNHYHELLQRDDVEAIYCAVPHHLHAQFYTDIIRAGKRMGEKPFGIDFAANRAILRAVEEKPRVLVRCSSEFPFFPGAYAIIRALREKDFGKIVEVESGFLHSSDLNSKKSINWKRMIEYNGEYGCMGDLGIHTVHIPLRFGWFPTRVQAQLMKLSVNALMPKAPWFPAEPGTTRPSMARSIRTGAGSLTIHTKRIAPGKSTPGSSGSSVPSVRCPTRPNIPKP